MALSRQRKTEIIIRVAGLLERMPADKAIHAAGGTTQDDMFRGLNHEDVSFVENLLEGTIAATARDLQGNLRVWPR
jgi:hypothetical protein